MCHKEELHDWYSLPYINRVIKSRIRWEGHGSRVEDRRNAYKILVLRPGGKRQFGRPSLRWEDNVLEVQKLEWRVMTWVDLMSGQRQGADWRAFMKAVMNLCVTSNTGNFWIS